jgi:hypothetical protein
MPLKLKPHPQIWKAIKQKRMMWLIYHDKVRIIEPHDHGILNGSVQLLAWQVDGASSRPLPNWLLTKVDEMVDLTTQADTFPGGRPLESADVSNGTSYSSEYNPRKAPTPPKSKGHVRFGFLILSCLRNSAESSVRRDKPAWSRE